MPYRRITGIAITDRTDLLVNNSPPFFFLILAQIFPRYQSRRPHKIPRALYLTLAEWITVHLRQRYPPETRQSISISLLLPHHFGRALPPHLQFLHLLHFHRIPSKKRSLTPRNLSSNLYFLHLSLPSARIHHLQFQLVHQPRKSSRHNYCYHRPLPPLPRSHCVLHKPAIICGR